MGNRRDDRREEAARSRAWAVGWMRLAVSSLMVLGLALPVSAQQVRMLSGTVLDSSGRPIYGSQVEFDSAAETHRARTDAEGNFAIAGVGGPGTLQVAYPGFGSVTLTVGLD